MPKHPPKTRGLTVLPTFAIVAILQALLKYKANVNAVDPEDDMQETPLHKACVKSGNYEIVTQSTQFSSPSVIVFHGFFHRFLGPKNWEKP